MEGFNIYDAVEDDFVGGEDVLPDASIDDNDKVVDKNTDEVVDAEEIADGAVDGAVGAVVGAVVGNVISEVVGGAVSQNDEASRRLVPDEISSCSLASGRSGGEPCASDAAIAVMAKIVDGTTGGTGQTTNELTTVVEKAKEKLGCKDEKCVLESREFTSIAGKGAAQKELYVNFKLDGPTDTSLLSNVHIDSILGQWATKFNSGPNKFFAYDFNMADYEKTGGSLGTVDVISDIWDKGYRTFGCVINSDVSTGRGKHWMALFGDMRTSPMTVEFFNSSGNPPALPFARWLEKTRVRMEKVGPAVAMKVCKIVHQKSRTECGVYSLYYIWARLNGVAAEYFNHNPISDILCFELRQHLFEGSNMSKFDYEKFKKSADVKWERNLSDKEKAELKAYEEQAGGKVGGAGDSAQANTQANNIVEPIEAVAEEIHELTGETKRAMDTAVSVAKTAAERSADVAEELKDSIEKSSRRNVGVAVLAGLISGVSSGLLSVAFLGGSEKSHLKTQEEKDEKKVEVEFNMDMEGARELPHRKIDMRLTLWWPARSCLLAVVNEMNKEKADKIALYGGGDSIIDALKAMYPEVVVEKIDNGASDSTNDSASVISNDSASDTSNDSAKNKTLLVDVSGDDNEGFLSLYKSMRPAKAVLRYDLNSNLALPDCSFHFTPFTCYNSVKTTAVLIEGSAGQSVPDKEGLANKLFRHNLITRVYQRFDHDTTAEGVDKCWDCHAEMEILSRYLGERLSARLSARPSEQPGAPAPNVGDLSEWLSGVLGDSPHASVDCGNKLDVVPRSLVWPPHGVYKTTPPDEKIELLLKKYPDIVNAVQD